MKAKIKTPAELRAEQNKLIEHMLSAVEAELQDRGRENTFIESIRHQFDTQGWLSQNQVEALRKFYERSC